jgi:hypothetical protein
MKKLFVLFAATVALAVAAQTHRVTLFQESMINGATLKPGDYKMTLNANKVVIEKGKDRVEAQVSVETADTKFGATSVRYQNGDGKYRVKEIRIGGTSTKLIFDN